MKLRVLFIGGGDAVMVALRASLADFSDEWDMAFAAGTDKAMAWLREEEFDVACIDSDAPGVSINSMLAHLADNYPQTVRVLLSEAEAQLRFSRRKKAAHFSLRKPCSKAQLAETIHNAHQLHRLLWRESHELTVSDLREIMVDFFTAEILHQKLRFDEVPEKIKPFLSKDLLERISPEDDAFAHDGIEAELTGIVAENGWLTDE